MKKLLIISASALVSTSALAAPVIQAEVGYVPIGADIYLNFDGLPAGSAGGVENGVTVSFEPDGQAVTGDDEGKYAAPFISNGNGAPFGNNQSDGANVTQYLSTGIGEVILDLGGYHQYFGLLWGSVDDYNTLTFYDGGTALFSFNGLNVDALASGDQGADGTFYVRINSDTAFNRVVATSGEYAFEFDNVTLNSKPIVDVPEPGMIGLLGLGVLALGAARRRKTA